MIYNDLKQKLLSLFDEKKLSGNKGEWGFSNEQNKEIQKVGYCVNLTPKTIEKAHKEGIDFLLTHHDAWPFIFGMDQECQVLLKTLDLTHGFFHAPLDDADFGTSSSLANALALKNQKKIIPYEDIYMGGVVGTLETPATFTFLKDTLERILNEPIKGYKNRKGLISKICVAAGAGNMTTDMQIAVDEECDAYITGEYNLYSQLFAKFTNMSLLVGSHTNTEILGVENLAKKLAENTDLKLKRIKEKNY